MEFFQPDSWWEALEIKAAYLEAKPICGGTVVMVELNFDRERPGAEVASVEGVRWIPIGRFIIGPYETTLDPHELIAAVHIPRARGPQPPRTSASYGSPT